MAVTEEEAAAIQDYLQEILDSPVFHGSPRCGQFLKHVVDRAIAGHYDSLKERVIGMELFGRPPSYDTGDDAIVRVTASDVRKRLLQYYGDRNHTQFRITLPPGSYIPQIVHEPLQPAGAGRRESLHPDPIPLPNSTENATTTESVHESAVDDSEVVTAHAEPERHNRRILLWTVLGLVFVAMNAAWAAAFWFHAHQTRPESATVLPWSAFFGSAHATKLITSDPNIAEVQGFTGGEISLSDYANHKYVPDPQALTPEQLRFCTVILRGDKASVFDTPIAVTVAQFAEANGKKIVAQGARNTQLSDLQTGDNLILLGSPRSNPWVGFFRDHLDFRFEYDKDLDREYIRNIHPRAGELAVYNPTAPGWATGESYAIIAFIHNPDEDGQVLLLSGETGEGTEAAGRFVADLPKFAATLKQCGISPSDPTRHFEILLHLNTLAGLPNNVEVAACHIL